MASRTEVGDTSIFNSKVQRGLKLESLTIELAADNYPITANHPPVLLIDPTTNRDVLLPAINAQTAGLTFIIFNTGEAGEAITVKDSTDTALSPSVVIQGNEGAVVTNNGVAWKGIVGANT